MDGRIWFTADTHFGHDAIRRHCLRPFNSIEEMDQTMIQNWNSMISKKDVVFILGDFAWKNHSHYIMALKGKKILIRGNHDKMSLNVERNFTAVYDIRGTTIHGQYIVLCHYPMRSWNGKSYKSWHLYGHVHGRLSFDPTCTYSMDVGVDANNYLPISYEQIKQEMDKRQWYTPTEDWGFEEKGEEDAGNTNNGQEPPAPQVCGGNDSGGK